MLSRVFDPRRRDHKSHLHASIVTANKFCARLDSNQEYAGIT